MIGNFLIKIVRNMVCVRYIVNSPYTRFFVAIEDYKIYMQVVLEINR